MDSTIKKPSVRLISMTKPCGDDIKNLTVEELIVYVARVSNPSNQKIHSSAPRLLKYCVKNSHWSVFEQVDITFEIKTSRAIAAQILRHKTFVFQEFSLRYSEAVNIEEYEARRQDAKNKQNSIDDMSDEDKAWFKMAQLNVARTSMAYYKEALARGVAKEQARMLLPLATETTLYVKGSLRTWIHYIQVRADASTQKEHRDIALACKEIINKEFPSIAEALDW